MQSQVVKFGDVSAHIATTRTDVSGFYVNPEYSFFVLVFTKDLMRALKCHQDVSRNSERECGAQQ